MFTEANFILTILLVSWSNSVSCPSSCLGAITGGEKCEI